MLTNAQARQLEHVIDGLNAYLLKAIAAAVGPVEIKQDHPAGGFANPDNWISCGRGLKDFVRYCHADHDRLNKHLLGQGALADRLCRWFGLLAEMSRGGRLTANEQQLRRAWERTLLH